MAEWVKLPQSGEILPGPSTRVTGEVLANIYEGDSAEIEADRQGRSGAAFNGPWPLLPPGARPHA